MLRLGLVVLGVENMARAVSFWTEALNFEVTKGGPDAGWTELGPAGQGQPILALQRSQTPVQDHPRMHLDLHADSLAERDREIERLVSLGAKRVDWDSFPFDPDFLVLEDPERNIFCMVDAAHIPAEPGA
jgi:catechol 2,3-dioxygenase-like lactoylglutathione lyase family enzyme